MKTNFFVRLITSLIIFKQCLFTFVPMNKFSKTLLLPSGGVQQNFQFTKEMFPAKPIEYIGGIEGFVKFVFSYEEQGGYLFVKNPKNKNPFLIQKGDYVRIIQKYFPIEIKFDIISPQSNINDLFDYLNYEKSLKPNKELKLDFPLTFDFMEYDLDVSGKDFYKAIFSHKLVMERINEESPFTFTLDKIKEEIPIDDFKELQSSMMTFGLKQYLFDNLLNIFEGNTEVQDYVNSKIETISKIALSYVSFSEKNPKLTQELFLDLMNKVVQRDESINIIVETSRNFTRGTFSVPSKNDPDSPEKQELIHLATEKLYYGFMNMVFDQWSMEGKIIPESYHKKFYQTIFDNLKMLSINKAFKKAITETNSYANFVIQDLPKLLRNFWNPERVELLYFFEKNKEEIINFLTKYLEESSLVPTFTNIFINSETHLVNSERTFIAGQNINPTMFNKNNVILPYAVEEKRINRTLV